MVSEFRTFTVAGIEVTDFRDGMVFLLDEEGERILVSVETLEEIISKLKEGE